jgi:hypothetical protein
LSGDAASVDLARTDDHARVIYFTVTGRLVIQKIGLLERREIPVTLPLPPDDLWSIAASPDGRTLYYGAKRAEANIWRVEQPKAGRDRPALMVAHRAPVFPSQGRGSYRQWNRPGRHASQNLGASRYRH